ncbi:uncharacterized protein MONBRDRAFT_15918 [Monosiga brevicollis MX1]|uniref:glutaminase n=1 Tax=Monosiga brevicollis TaxID=81824 RepID=A9UVY3_MONBE|nr:uncharacterized protein MONBRDRAFT_15918 [Monosiga brevicollis MX1]EDQ90670.1 predicted protein [Monosiga brevicollis MX1]|eukprot:XP_001744721.1 hypothetical protein [Monosiga brevicollis MX1]
MAAPSVTIGVLALQGAFREHLRALSEFEGVSALPVRTKEQLATVDALVIPGGESTTMGLVAERSGLLEELRAMTRARQKPVFATCAGLIMLAQRAQHEKTGGQPLLGGLDVVVDRNFFGTQLQSFEATMDVRLPGDEAASTCHAVFIRAPAILEVGIRVEVLATLPVDKSPRPLEKPCIVAARQGPFLVTAFHPELTADRRWHAYFVDQVRATKG